MFFLLLSLLLGVIYSNWSNENIDDLKSNSNGMYYTIYK